jgi:predicted kinase
MPLGSTAISTGRSRALTSSAGPTLILVSGPPGSGKTTHAPAAAIPCPALCRDEIKEGALHAHRGGFQAVWGDDLTQRTLPLFFEALRTLLGAGVTLVVVAFVNRPPVSA